MCRRPKSREETPKEGGGNARTRIAALHQYAPASHKKQGLLTYFFTIPQAGSYGPAEGVEASLEDYEGCPYARVVIGSRAPR
jgi:hypothetical protein